MKKILVKYNLRLYKDKCPWTIGGRHGNLLKGTEISINILPWFLIPSNGLLLKNCHKVLNPACRICGRSIFLKTMAHVFHKLKFIKEALKKN